MERATNQKTIVLDYLKSVKTHPSAETIYKAVKRKLPNISLGTVYRILNNFKEKKEILEIPCEVSHYDGDTSSHSHFICEKCKKIFDIFESHSCRTGIIKTKVGKINNCQIYYYGICKKCKNK